jgi:hypothetical protein|tara:strand:+ start:2197 stop:2424 length:228 start_codon:yes stop_codon:yes gene_type:complete
MLSLEQLGALPKDCSTASLVYDRPLLTKGNNVIFLDQYHLRLQPFEKQSLVVSLKTVRPEKVEEYFEAMVKDGQS